ncbi:SET and MYND domain-containing protein 4-like [Argonauta hians]
MATQVGNWTAVLDDVLDKFDRDGSLESFRKLTTNQERIDYILNKNIVLSVPWISIYLEYSNEFDVKNCKRSIESRQKGNKEFQKKNFSEALEHYSKSLAFAPLTSSEPALCYSNRSAVLYQLGLYQACIDNIEQVRQCPSIPTHLPPRLGLRKAQCHYYLKHYEEAIGELHAGKKILLETKYEDPRKKEDLLSNYEDWLKKLESHSVPELTSDMAECHLSDDVSDTCTTLSHGKNSVVSAASSALGLHNNPTSGRHLRTEKAVTAGDVLIVEKPYAAILLPEYLLSHCHNCFIELISPIPCQRCCNVLYCSHACRQKDWSSSHYMECYFLRLLHSVGIAHLSLRIILVTGLQFLLDFQKSYPQDTCHKPDIAGLTVDGHYETNYLSVYELLTHSDLLAVEDNLQYTVTAVLLLHLLKYFGWFQDKLTVQEILDRRSNDTNVETSDLWNWSQQHRVIGTFLLHHIQQLVCNGHAIAKLDFSDPIPTTVNDGVSVETSSEIRLATAIYPTVSLLNHSCQPSISLSFQGNTLVVRAVKDISEGKEVFSCYGPHSFRMEFAQRQLTLKDQYFFTCQCEACIHESSNRHPYKDEECSQCYSFLPCKNFKEHKKSTTLGLANQMEKACSLINSEKCEEALSLMRHCSAVGKEIFTVHNSLYGELQDIMARCLVLLGRYDEACVIHESNLKIIEECYGSTSIEFARTLQNYVELLMVSAKTEKASEIIQQAKSLFSIHFGFECPENQKLSHLAAKLDKIKNPLV